MKEQTRNVNKIINHYIMETKILAIDKTLYEEALRYASSKGTDLTTLVACHESHECHESH